MHTEPKTGRGHFTVMWLLVAALLTGACTTAQETERRAELAADARYQRVYLVVELAESADSEALTGQLIRSFSQRGIAITQAVPGAANPDSPLAGSAILRIDEVGREIVSDRYHRTYPRYPLTANRGWKTADKPVIKLRATLVDSVSGRVMFEAEYVNEGPWYADSETVVSALARELPEQLQREGYLAASPRK